MKLYFVRHGESEANEQNLFAGRADSPLTALGRRQAEQAGQAVAKLGLQFDEIHVSTLQRAGETAMIIGTFLADQAPAIFATETLVERDFGVLSEKNKSLIKKSYGPDAFERMFHSFEGAPPDGESFDEMYQRTKKYFDEVLLPRAREGKSILVVSHKYIVEMFALIASGQGPESYVDFRIPNSKPSSFEELSRHAKAASHSMNRFAEATEAHLAWLLASAVLIGIALRLAVNIDLPVNLLKVLSVGFLAINSFIAFLRVDRSLIKKAHLLASQVAIGAAIRVGFAIALILGLGGPAGTAAGTFLLLPPAMTAPTLSLMWGGNYFLSVQATLILSLVSLVVLPFLGKIHVGDFVLLLSLSAILPALLAQIMRQRDPIRAGALSTNWGWTGGLALIPLALITGYGLTPLHLATTWPREILFAATLFLVIRLLAYVAGAFSGLSKERKLDVRICHAFPNLFFWSALLPGLQGSLIPISMAILFFVSIWGQERFHVLEFRKSIHSIKGDSYEKALNIFNSVDAASDLA